MFGDVFFEGSASEIILFKSGGEKTGKKIKATVYKSFLKLCFVPLE